MSPLPSLVAKNLHFLGDPGGRREMKNTLRCLLLVEREHRLGLVRKQNWNRKLGSEMG